MKMLRIIAVQLRLYWQVNTAVAVALLVAIAFFTDMPRWDFPAFVLVMQRYASLIGIVLFVPVFSPEEHGGITAVVCARPFPLSAILFIRLLLAVLTCLLLVDAMGMLAQVDGFGLPLLLTLYATPYCIGATGFLVVAVSGSTILGYFVSTAYFVMNAMTVPATSALSLFPLTGGTPVGVWRLYFAGSVFLALAFCWRMERGHRC
jgi:hypothetical protein